MARPVRGLDMDSDQRNELESLVRAPTTPQRSALRARIVLACADGLSQEEAARQVGVRRRIVTKWCGRFRRLGLAGLADASGRGRKPFLSEESRALILTQATRPPKGQTRHSVRLTDRDFESLTNGRETTPEQLVRKSFEFLLERESKNQILRQFDLTVISRYFPEYPTEILKRL